MSRWLLLLLLFLSCQTSSGDPEVRCLFENPLVIGASISEGYGTSDGGPAQVLSKLLYSGAKVTNKAEGGQKSTESTRELELPVKTTIVLGLDLFFWDAARNVCSADFEAHTRKLFVKFEEAGVPVVVGKVPLGVAFPEGIKLAGRMPCAGKINRLLRELCTPEKNCVLYDPGECFRKMESAGKYFIDRLHTNEAGNEFCARQFADSGAHEMLRCRRPPAP